MKTNHLLLLAFLVTAAPFGLPAAMAKTTADHTEGARKPAGLAVKKGDKIVFMGDSITEAGDKAPNGYVNLVVRALAQQGLEVTHVGAGVSGQKSNDMLARVGTEVIGNKPQWLLLSCGVNDVWHCKLRLGKQTFHGVPLEDYKRDIQNKMTTDGCHMNNLGNIMMAKGILRAFGLSDDKIAAAEKSWNEEEKPAPAKQ